MELRNIPKTVDSFFTKPVLPDVPFELGRMQRVVIGAQPHRDTLAVLYKTALIPLPAGMKEWSDGIIDLRVDVHGNLNVRNPGDAHVFAIITGDNGMYHAISLLEGASTSDKISKKITDQKVPLFAVKKDKRVVLALRPANTPLLVKGGVYQPDSVKSGFKYSLYRTFEPEQGSTDEESLLPPLPEKYERMFAEGLKDRATLDREGVLTRIVSEK